MSEQRHITIGYSTHRPETLPRAATVMERHEAIVLEEPHSPEFGPMLKGELDIEQYLLLSDFEFPDFTRQSCLLYQRLQQQGKRLFQCDPYMERLTAIRAIFDAGGKPADIEPHGDLGTVYTCERRWTAALLAYYENCLRAPFDVVVEDVKRFAREDATRNRLRDELRAQAISELASPFATLYIEAGSLHLSLLNQLRTLLGAEYAIAPVYLTAPVVKRLCGHRHALGPGEKLTLHYTYRPRFSGERAERLAAQSLLHSKIQLKEEYVETEAEFPHTRDEIETAAWVNRLNYAHCRELYDKIKGLGTLEARAAIRDYLKKNGL
jgi:hypothetical protein